MNIKLYASFRVQSLLLHVHFIIHLNYLSTLTLSLLPCSKDAYSNAYENCQQGQVRGSRRGGAATLIEELN